MTPPAARRRTVGRTLGRRRRDRRERRRLAAVLRTETVGGALLVAAAVVALAVANSPLAHLYADIRDRKIGPASLGLDLSIGQWTADGMLAIFFFLAGLELKHEFVAGQLRERHRAVVPVLAAVGGMVAPALVYVVINIGNPGAGAGWAIPTATDIAFALAVLAVVGRNLPSELRTFLLALAVVDDLLAIIIIAVFFTHEVSFGFLVASLAVIATFALVVRRCRNRLALRRALLTVTALVAWALMLRSGVHATVAGVLMGFTVPVIGKKSAAARPNNRYDVSPGQSQPAAAVPTEAMARRIDDFLRPISAGIAVPLFAFFAAGVTVGGLSGLGAALSDRVALGVAGGLVIGKTVGILVTTLVVGRLVHSPLMESLALLDWIGVAVVGGVGFTVSLLIGHLAFVGDEARIADAQVGVVAGSLVAALVAAVVLGIRSRHYANVRQRQGRAATASPPDVVLGQIGGAIGE